MPNKMDSRVRSAFDICADLRKISGLKLAVLGSRRLEAKDVRSMLIDQRSTICELVGAEPRRLVTGDLEVGAEKGVRLAAKEFTGKRPVVFHRAEMTYGKKGAENMLYQVLTQHTDALLLLTVGKTICDDAVYLFKANRKKVYEVEVG